MASSTVLARQLALDLRRRAESEGGQLPPLDPWLESLLRERGFRIRALRPADPRLAGGIAAVAFDEAMVFHARDLGDPERRFALAHEIGHCLLHRRSDNPPQRESDWDAESAGIVGYSPQERREVEANAFARALLVDVADCERLAAGGATLAGIAAELGVPVSCVRGALLVGLGDTMPRQPGSSTVSFDDSQLSAVQISNQGVRVEAGPGTGKTQVLVGRIAHLVNERGFDPAGILVLTFSRAAAETVHSRLIRDYPDWGAKVPVSTLHAYGLDLIRRYSQQLGLPLRPTLLSKADVRWVLIDLLRQLPAEELAHKFPEMIANELADWLGDPPDKGDEPEFAAEFRRRYAQWKRDHGAIDYRDMILLAVRLLSEERLILEAERARIRAVLVDESQDLDNDQARIIGLLGHGELDRLWVVGDPGQRIYGFRGAGVGDSFELPGTPAAAVISLDVNYRSLPEIVRALGETSHRDANRWASARVGAGEVTVATAISDSAQDCGVARVLQFANRRGRPWSDMAVLFRTHGLKTKMRDALRAAGVPVREERDDQWLTQSPIVEIFDRLAELTVSAHENIAPEFELYPAIEGMLWGPHRLFSTLDTRARIGARALLQLVHAYKTRSWLYRLPEENDLQGFLRFARIHRESGELPVDSDNGVPDPNAVLLTTIHAAKGREFGLVVLPYLNSSIFPPHSGGYSLPFARRRKDFQEEERLFFVGLSRARDVLVVSCVEGKRRRPSELLDSLREVTHRVAWTEVTSIASDRLPVPQSESVAIEFKNLVRWQRCSAQVVFDRISQRRVSVDNGYPVFHTSVVASLFTENPLEEFRRQWDGRVSTLPASIHLYYRQLAEMHLGQSEGRMLVESAPESQIRVENHVVSVRADGLDQQGRPVRIRIRIPKPLDKQPSSTDLTDFLLLSAHDDTVFHGYPSVRRVESVHMTPAKKGYWREILPTIINDYHSGVGRAQPSDEIQCQHCPHWFRCPRDGSMVTDEARRQGSRTREGNALG